uniref:hypothetical protein n=1 Tax=Ligilactobacillus acidipiscis TaxID=89059 RepID=UPI001785EAE6|nr:hypothetical protein [Ligilactobacillus acidipiscis]
MITKVLSFLRAFCVLKSASFFAKFGAKEQPIFARKGELRGGAQAHFLQASAEQQKLSFCVQMCMLALITKIVVQ